MKVQPSWILVLFLAQISAGKGFVSKGRHLLQPCRMGMVMLVMVRTMNILGMGKEEKEKTAKDGNLTIIRLKITVE